MSFSIAFFLFIIAQFGRQCHVLAEDPLYECYVTYLDINTWRLKGSSFPSDQYQNCYQPGRVDLVRNEFVLYTVQTSFRLMVEIDFWFYNGTSKTPFCLVHTVNFEIYPDDQDRCNKNGVTWKLINDADQYILSVDYLKANFSTTIQHGDWTRKTKPYVNIYLWLTKSLATRSSGICIEGDRNCIPISPFFDLTTELTPDDTATDTTTIESTQEISTTTTTTVPIAPFQCGVYQDIYIQTWHPIGQAFPPSRSCLGKAATFELVKNNYLRYTLHSNGSAIDELTLILFDETSTEAICTVSAIGQVISWMDCEQNGIIPSLLTTPTHETLTVYYANAHFTTTVTRDIGIYVGRFNIVTYLNPELALRSTGICNLASPCVGTDRAL